MILSINAGYGRAIVDEFYSNDANAGMVFIVCPSTHPNYQTLQAAFKNFPDGTVVFYNTIAAAVAAVTDKRGDYIYVCEGHTETISSATALTIAGGVNLVGLGTGALRPTITLDTANTSTINITANNVGFKNFIFVANFLNIASLFTLTTATDFQLVSCEVRDTSGILNFLAVVTTDTTSNHADGLLLDSNKIISKATSGAVLLVSPLGTNDRWTFRNNYYAALTTGTGAVIPIATGKILTNFLLLNNRFNVTNAAGTATAYLITTNGTTNSGFIDGNMDHALPTTPLLVTASSGFVYGANYHSDQADTSGYLLPVADA